MKTIMRPQWGVGYPLEGFSSQTFEQILQLINVIILSSVCNQCGSILIKIY